MTSNSKIREHDIEQRSYIRYLVKTGTNGYAIRQKVKEVYGDNAISKSSIYKWVKRFSDGREDVSDNGRSGRPATSTTEKNVEKIREMLKEDEGMTLRKISDRLNISKGSTSRIVAEHITGKIYETIPCFMCLDNLDKDNTYINIIQKTGIEMQQLIYIMPELIATSTDTPIYICDTCNTAISSFYAFKKMCLENSKRWKHFTKHFTKTADKTKSNNSKEVKQNKAEKPPTNHNVKELNKKQDTEVEQISILVDPEFISEPYSDPEEEIVSEETETNDQSNEEITNKKSKSKSAKTKKTWSGTCTICKRSFTQKSVFQSHFRMHTDGRKHKCEKCGKFYTTKSHLTRHMKIHCKELNSRKKFKCAGCNTGFVRKINLKNHLKNTCKYVTEDSEINN